MKAKESREMYLETIFKLQDEDGRVRSVDVARELNLTKASVSRAISVLGNAGFVSHTPYGDISLTSEGRKKAERIFAAHGVITDFLKNALGLDEETAEEDACRIEHVISDTTIDAMKLFNGS